MASLLNKFSLWRIPRRISPYLRGMTVAVFAVAVLSSCGHRVMDDPTKRHEFLKRQFSIETACMSDDKEMKVLQETMNDFGLFLVGNYWYRCEKEQYACKVSSLNAAQMIYRCNAKISK